MDDASQDPQLPWAGRQTLRKDYNSRRLAGHGPILAGFRPKCCGRFPAILGKVFGS